MTGDHRHIMLVRVLRVIDTPGWLRVLMVRDTPGWLRVIDTLGWLWTCKAIKYARLAEYTEGHTHTKLTGDTKGQMHAGVAGDT